jgi:ornithine cyclodeaminase/alanine dehydrogenase-like protein (mu-crystallin family)
MTQDQPLFLTEDDVRAVLTYEELIPSVRQGLMDYSAGRVQQPVRMVMAAGGGAGWFALMPALYDGLMGAKLVTFFPRNAMHGRHTHHAMIQLFCSETGEPLAVMDGRFITEMRTAAVSAIAIEHLSRKDAKVLAVLGSGVQARSHLRALALVRSFAEIRVWSRTRRHAEAFASEAGGRVFSTVGETVTGADVVLR